ncbi:hypothetical protein H8L32_22540 [Undibacterium sp. CY18W]|uniref:SGNH/GDSL hydrolase family protein n=1 Tax=Undibacterium hunanense TaxID=2762292 RepID=A0ABR6ZWP3_9BURK|nr:hypothetical protein [Undibacterium hunanense]MBC3920260.1 hypothetical protein [Undibacterium hunanense]
MPAYPWKRIFAFILLLTLAAIIAMELSLRSLGYLPTALDSKERWSHERGRASQLGPQALTLIGTSRFQLGMDLDTLRQGTGLEAIQLAIDGSSFVPVLKNLADDPRVTGTILIDYTSGALANARQGNFGSASVFVDEYEKQQLHFQNFSADTLEKKLTTAIHENLSIFSDGSNPWFALRYRILPWKRSSQYITTRPDRSRLADYSRLPWPDVYYSRVAKQLGMEWNPRAGKGRVEMRFLDKIKTMPVASQEDFQYGGQLIRGYIDAIQKRGGKVLFVKMPTTGLVKEADEQLYPEDRFLDVFFANSHLPILYDKNYPAIKDFKCPDGSHLDQKDRASFSAIVARFVAGKG